MAKRKKKPAPMLEGVPVPTSSTPNPADMERDKEMFRVHYFEKKTYEELAVQFGMSFPNVSRIARKYKWKALKVELGRRALAASMEDVRDMTVMIVRALNRDLQHIVDSAIRDKRPLTKEERDHFRGLLDRSWKEMRLEEGKPTENTGVLSVELRLPKGVTGFGIFPPDPRVKYVEATEDEEKDVIDLDEIEDKEKAK